MITGKRKFRELSDETKEKISTSTMGSPKTAQHKAKGLTVCAYNKAAEVSTSGKDSYSTTMIIRRNSIAWKYTSTHRMYRDISKASVRCRTCLESWRLTSSIRCITITFQPSSGSPKGDSLSCGQTSWTAPAGVDDNIPCQCTIFTPNTLKTKGLSSFQTVFRSSPCIKTLNVSI